MVLILGLCLSFLVRIIKGTDLPSLSSTREAFDCELSYKVADLLSHSFNDFFNASTSTAAPNSLGFDGLFRGAFSYHFHNYW